MNKSFVSVLVVVGLLGFIAGNVSWCATYLREIRAELRKLNGKIDP